MLGRRMVLREYLSLDTLQNSSARAGVYINIPPYSWPTEKLLKQGKRIVSFRIFVLLIIFLILLIGGVFGCCDGVDDVGLG